MDVARKSRVGLLMPTACLPSKRISATRCCIRVTVCLHWPNTWNCTSVLSVTHLMVSCPSLSNEMTDNFNLIVKHATTYLFPFHYGYLAQNAP